MHLNAQPPLFVPAEHRAEVEKLSKAALMDLVWDLINGANGAEHMDDSRNIETFRQRAEIVLTYRKKTPRRRAA